MMIIFVNSELYIDDEVQKCHNYGTIGRSTNNFHWVAITTTQLKILDFLVNMCF